MSESQAVESPLWKARFFTIWGGQSFSLLGSALVRFALIWWVTDVTGSALSLATATLVSVLPMIVLGPFAGTLVDRWKRRWVMVVADGAIALFTAVLAVLFWRDAAEMWHVYAILGLRAVGTMFHDPAMTASTSLMVPHEQLTRIAGFNQTRWSITEITGAPLGALLVMVLPMQGVLAIDVLTALIAIVPLLFIDVPQPDVQPVAQSGEKRSLFGDTVAGVRYLWGWRGMFTMVTSISLIQFFARPATSLAPLLIRDHFGGGAMEIGWGLVAFHAGSLVGGLLMSTWGGFSSRVKTIWVGLLGFGLLNLVRGLAPGNAFWLYLVATLISGPAISMAGASYRAILQSTVPPEMQGRILSVNTSIRTAMGPLGLLLLAPVADRTGVPLMFILRGAAFLFVGVLWCCLPSVRKVEDGPPAQKPPLHSE